MYQALVITIIASYKKGCTYTRIQDVIYRLPVRLVTHQLILKGIPRLAAARAHGCPQRTQAAGVSDFRNATSVYFGLMVPISASHQARGPFYPPRLYIYIGCGAVPGTRYVPYYMVQKFGSLKHTDRTSFPCGEFRLRLHKPDKVKSGDE